MNSHKIIKSIYSGVDIGKTFFENLHSTTDMLAHCNHDDLRILMPLYMIDILIRRRHSPYDTLGAQMQALDSEGYFKWFNNIRVIEGYEDKIVMFHKDYPLYKTDDLIYEFDLTLFITDYCK